MENQPKILGWIFLVLGLVNLIHPEWIDFGIFAAVGIGLLIEAGKSKVKIGLQVGLMMLAFGLMIWRVWTDLSR